jgi:enterochelin esterase-like enzyme
VNLILDNLYAAEKLKNMIVVMPSGQVTGAPRRMMQRPGVDGNPPSKDFLEDLIPFVRRTYPV